MAEIRELVTLFTFKMEEAGINKYKAAVDGIKDTAKTLAGVFGLAFGAEKIYSFVEGLIDAGKESNKVIYQIQRLARSGDDLTNIQDTLLNSAMGLGVAYIDVADTFKEMLRESESLKISTGDVVTVVENLYKTFRVGRLGSAEQKEVLSYLNSQFRRGGLMTARAVNTLADISTETMNLLRDAFGPKGQRATMEQMEAMAKNKELTTEKIVAALSKRNAKLDADFAKAPIKLSQALTNIYSRLTVTAGKLFKMVDNSKLLGKIVTDAFNLASKAVETFVKWLGGAEEALSLLSITLGVVVAAKIIPWLYTAIKGLNLFTLATWRAILPWAAWAIAIAAVVILIEDLYAWITDSKDSAMADLVGPFAEWKKTIADLPFVKLLTAFKDFATLDFSGGITKLKEALSDPVKLLSEMETLISIAIPVAFGTWALIKFPALLAELFGLSAATKTAATEIAKVGEGAAAAAAPAGLKAGTSFVEGFTKGLAGLALAIVAADLAQQAVPFAEELGRKTNKAIRENLPGAKYIIPEAAPKGTPTILDRWEKDAIDSILHPSVVKPPPGGYIEQGSPSADIAPRLDWWSELGKRIWYGPESVQKEAETSRKPSGPRLNIPTSEITTPGAIGPGALGPTINSGPVNNSVNPAMTLNATISVTTTPQEEAIAAEIKSQLNGAGNSMVDQMARQLSGSAPRTERATQ